MNSLTRPTKKAWYHTCKKEIIVIVEPNKEVECTSCKSPFCEIIESEIEHPRNFVPPNIQHVSTLPGSQSTHKPTYYSYTTHCRHGITQLARPQHNSYHTVGLNGC